jgi:LmbE family N-acetylglucosaminyl deacetylase
MPPRLRGLLGRYRRAVRLAAARSTDRVIGGTERRRTATWQEQVRARGVDITEHVDQASGHLLVVAPHPDDETIGCGVLMARRRRQGRPVTVVVVSDGGTSHRSPQLSPAALGEIRREESASACALLGVTDVRFLGFDEHDLRRERAGLVASLAGLVSELRPREVLVPSGRDWHPEHRTVHDRALEACRRAGFDGTIREYPVWYWNDGPSGLPPMAPPWARVSALFRFRRLVAATPRAWTVSTAGYEDLKRSAFAEYRTQTTSYTGEASWQPFPPGWLDQFVTGPEVFWPAEATVPQR